MNKKLQHEIDVAHLEKQVRFFGLLFHLHLQ